MTAETTTATPSSGPSSGDYLRGLAAVADYLGVCTKTVQRAMDKHLLPYIRLGSAVLFRRQEVEASLDALRTPAIWEEIKARRASAKKGA